MIFKTTPNYALLLKASHRQSTSAFSTVFNPHTDGVIGPHTDPMRDGTILPHLLRQFILPHTDLKFTESENDPLREVESERERGGREVPFW